MLFFASTALNTVSKATLTSNSVLNLTMSMVFIGLFVFTMAILFNVGKEEGFMKGVLQGRTEFRDSVLEALKRMEQNETTREIEVMVKAMHPVWKGETLPFPNELKGE